MLAPEVGAPENGCKTSSLLSEPASLGEIPPGDIKWVRALAALGVFGSSLLATGSFAFIIFPKLADWAEPGYFAPLGVFEVTMGFWLLLKGLRPSVVAEPTKVGD